MREDDGKRWQSVKCGPHLCWTTNTGAGVIHDAGVHGIIESLAIDGPCRPAGRRSIARRLAQHAVGQDIGVGVSTLAGTLPALNAAARIARERVTEIGPV